MPGCPGSQAATKVLTQACTQLCDVAVGRQICGFEHESNVHGVEPASGSRFADSALDGQHGEQNVPLSVARVVAILGLLDGLRERVRLRIVALHLSRAELDLFEMDLLVDILDDFHFRPSQVVEYRALPCCL